MRLLHGGSCGACKERLVSEVTSPTDLYIGFKEYSCTVEYLT
jgi:hypothetical protein